MLIQLHDQIAAAGIPINGVSAGEDGYSIDFQEEATEEQRQAALAIVENFAPTFPPDWHKLVSEFQFPGNPLYSAVLGQVAAAGYAAQDHWNNVKTVLSTPQLQSVQTLAAAIAHLDWLLSEAGHPLSGETRAGWNNLLTDCHFPKTCFLSVPAA